MSIEDEFGITISDSDSETMRTVDDLVSLCLARIHAAKSTRCPALPSFISLRRLVREIREEPNLRIKPSDKIEDCLSIPDRKVLWDRLPELLNTKPRELRRPVWLRKFLVLVVLALPLFLCTVLPWSAEILVLIWFATFLFGIVLHTITIGSRSLTPEGYHTFGEVTKRIVGLQFATNPPRDTEYHTVFSIVKRIVAEQLGVDDEEVLPTSRFIEDLGVG